MPHHASLDTPLGRFVIVANDAGLTHIQPEGSPKLPSLEAASSDRSRDHAERGAAALAAYFDGCKDAFDAIELAPAGSAFQVRVWRALRDIPYGQTESYGQLAARIDRPGAARAVGTANHHNPIAIAVPCHRVIGTRGALVGYAGGLDRKRWLLVHEGALEPGLPFADER